MFFGDFYFKNGNFHRLNGPAVIWKNGREQYYIEGINYSKEEWEKKVEEIDPPTYINPTGDKFWYNSKGQSHRDNDLPAIIYSNGSKTWCRNEKFHRLNGPARIWKTLSEEYWIDGIRFSKENFELAVQEINEVPTKSSKEAEQSENNEKIKEPTAKESPLFFPLLGFCIGLAIKASSNRKVIQRKSIENKNEKILVKEKDEEYLK